MKQPPKSVRKPNPINVRKRGITVSVFGSFQSNNDRGNPAAAIDVDVSNDAIGGLGSPLGSVAFRRTMRCRDLETLRVA